MTVQKLKNNLGFTLVELLIVIALLGAIALIVIAAINPIEQANRARDTRFKADGAQLISAIDRYFAAIQEFPWVTSGDAADNDASYGFVSAGDAGIGLCGANGCGADPDGTLIMNDELKPEFKNRDFIKNHGGTDSSKKLFMGKETGTSESVYACFIPAAKATRQKAVTDGKVYTISTVDGTRTVTTLCDLEAANWVISLCFTCIPE